MIVKTSSIAVAALVLPCFQAAQAQTMLSIVQRHRALGVIKVEIAKNGAMIREADGNCFVINGPKWDVSVFNEKRKRIARLTFSNFLRNGPKHIEYFEGATPWPLVVEKANIDYKGVPATLYALPFKFKNGRLVDLKRGKAGEYCVARAFTPDWHVLTFLQQMFHIPPADGIPLKYTKLGHPYEFGFGLKYNKIEDVFTILDTIEAKTVPVKKFDIPKGYKLTTESDVTLGGKTDDMRDIMDQLNN